MQSLQAYPTWERTNLAVQPKYGVFAYVRGLSFAIWILSQLVGYWYISDWFVRQDLMAEGFDIKRYFYFGFGAFLIAQLTLGVQAWFAAPFQMVTTYAGGLVTAFCVWMVLLSPLSAIPTTSLVYASATWLSVLMLWLYWTNNYNVLKRCFLVACWAHFAWWLVLLVRHGLYGGFGGTIGDVNRNITGTAALAALICGLFTPNRYLRWAACAAALFFIVIVSSRGSLVALSAFSIVYFTLYGGIFRSAAVGGILGVCVLLFILAVPSVRHEVSDKVFHIHDSARGIGSGFTGRIEMWKQGLEWFWKKPVFGYGFRATSLTRGIGFGGVHSAYIKILLEAGIIGAFLIVGAVVIEAYRRMRIVLRLRVLQPHDMPGINIADSLRLNVITCSTMCLVLTMWVYDQYYINLGSPVSVMFFLMLMAPTYVSNQGNTLRALN
jgi:O-antigen ligase